MIRSRRHRPLVFALYVNAALLLAILFALLSRSSSWLPSASAAPPVPQPIAGNGSLYLMPAQFLNNVWGCYLLDIDNQTLTAYTYNGNQLVLRCARNIRYDHELDEYNTSPPIAEVQKLVEVKRGKMHGAAQPPPPEVSPSTQPVGNEPGPVQGK